MVISKILDNKNFKILTKKYDRNRKITGVYIGDLLSHALSRLKKGNAWLTIHGHINIIAVGLMADVSCIIVADDACVSKETIIKANEENVILMATSLPSYEIAKFFVEYELDDINNINLIK